MSTDKLRELAQAATEGPWVNKWRHYVIPQIHADRPVGGSTNNDQDRDNYAQLISTSTDDNHGRGKAKANAAYIAAANPTAILELLDALKAAKKSLAFRAYQIDDYYDAVERANKAEAALKELQNEKD